MPPVTSEGIQNLESFSMPKPEFYEGYCVFVGGGGGNVRMNPAVWQEVVGNFII